MDTESENVVGNMKFARKYYDCYGVLIAEIGTGSLVTHDADAFFVWRQVETLPDTQKRPTFLISSTMIA
jgi:hypothetical protein